MMTPSPSLQPQSRSLELRDGERLVGWITDDVVRFHRFESERQAAQAAAIAHRGMMRRLARGGTLGPSATKTDPSVLSSPGNGVNDSGFGFEIRVPPPNDELRMRGIAYVMYRSLRNAGLSWPRTHAPAATESPTAQVAYVADKGDRSASDVTKGGSNVIERLLQSASRIRALPWRPPHPVG
jgi:hypothetical protein